MDVRKLATTATVGVGGLFVRQLRLARHGADPQRHERWQGVTIFHAEVDPDHLPEPLAQLADRIETRVQPAPGGKGTELAGRPAPGTSPRSSESLRSELRAALRRSKQLLEVGEVLAVDPAPHGARTATPGGAILEAVTGRADREGVL